jgi:hypothetical protein
VEICAKVSVLEITRLVRLPITVAFSVPVWKLRHDAFRRPAIGCAARGLDLTDAAPLFDVVFPANHLVSPRIILAQKARHLDARFACSLVQGVL